MRDFSNAKQAGLQNWFNRVRHTEGPGLGRDGIPTQAELNKIRPYLDAKELKRLQGLIDRHESKKQGEEMPPADPQAQVDQYLQPPPDPQAQVDQYLQPPAAPQTADPQAAVDAHLQAPQEPPPPPSTLEAVKALLSLKYAVLLAYIVYGDQLRCLERDGLYKHFNTHAEEVREWIYTLHRILAARGDVSYPTGVSTATPPLLAPRPCIEALAEAEIQILDSWAACVSAAQGDPALSPSEQQALVSQFQEGSRVDLAHLEDMRRYLGDAL